MYGGDEVSAIVIDIGADTTKAGYAGEDTPKTVFSSAVGVLAGEEGGAKQYSVDELHYPKPGLEVINPFTDGVVSSWEGYEQARNAAQQTAVPGFSVHACSRAHTHTNALQRR